MRQRFALGGVGIAALLGFLLLVGGVYTKPLSAMEQMADNIREAKSYVYTVAGTVTFDSPEPGEPRVATLPSGTYYWLAPGSVRRDFRARGESITGTGIRPVGRPGIRIDHLKKTFEREPLRREEKLSTFDDLEFLGRFSGKADGDLGTKVIDGKEAQGFQIDMQKMEPSRTAPGLAEIWISTESHLPVLVRYDGIRRRDHTMTIEMKDIRWNVNLDPGLFDTTPPKGYVDVTPQWTVAELVDQIATAFRTYAKASGGQYPPDKKINSVNMVDALCKMLGIEKFTDDAEEGNAAEVVEAIPGFCRIGEIQMYNVDAAYYGKTVGPSDKEKVLLRWKLDDGRYAVIFGDLRSEIVTADRLRHLEGK
jgi:outer membrane lipoprotein-sorting protein